MNNLQFLKVVIVSCVIASAGGFLSADDALASTSSLQSVTVRLKKIRETIAQRASQMQEVNSSGQQGRSSDDTLSQYYWPNWGNWPNWRNWRNWINWGNWGNF
jgi:hypothetical protein